MTSPSNYKRMLKAMADNLKKYEDRFGEVKEVEGLDNQEIGFQAN